MLIGTFYGPFRGFIFKVGKEECDLFFDYLEDVGSKLLRNISNNLPVQAESRTRTRQLSSKTMWKPQITQHMCNSKGQSESRKRQSMYVRNKTKHMESFYNNVRPSDFVHSNDVHLCVFLSSQTISYFRENLWPLSIDISRNTLWIPGQQYL